MYMPACIFMRYSTLPRSVVLENSSLIYMELTIQKNAFFSVLAKPNICMFGRESDILKMLMYFNYDNAFNYVIMNFKHNKKSLNLLKNAVCTFSMFSRRSAFEI